MKKTMSVVAVTSLFVAGSAMASGYRIPEQSVDSTAKAGANIASASSADVTYFNPAGMALLEDTWYVEGGASYVHLTSIDYADNRSPMFDGSSEKEHFLLPSFFVVSPDYNNFRFGFALTAPYGLAKRWQDPLPAAFSNKFELAVVEFNPTVSYKINDILSVGGGVRLLYNRATVMNNPSGIGSPYTRWVDGDTTEFGYNLAVDVKPSDNWNFAVTYRSHVDLDFEGDVQIFGYPEMDGEVTVPAPAVLAFSAAYTYDKWTFDLTVDQTYWSEYEYLDFNYALSPIAIPNYENPIPKNWDDTVAIRLGVEYRLSPTLTLMGGVAHDENPVPTSNLGFELPDSDAWLYSLGVRYKYSEQMEFGAAVLYDYKEERDVSNGTIEGEFSNASAILVSVGMSYKF
jgi:long-chain fatty acid transport protein